jgi:hypothetical protein
LDGSFYHRIKIERQCLEANRLNLERRKLGDSAVAVQYFFRTAWRDSNAWFCSPSGGVFRNLPEISVDAIGGQADLM